jgi:hypothetical protein
LIPIVPTADQGHWQPSADEAEETFKDAKPTGPGDEAGPKNGRSDPLFPRRSDQRLRVHLRRSVRPNRALGM